MDMRINRDCITGVPINADSLHVNCLCTDNITTNRAEFDAMAGKVFKILVGDAIKALFTNAVVYRNGRYTTVKWGDGSITRVTCKDTEFPTDELGFEAALVKRIFGSRNAFTKFLDKSCVDVAHEKYMKKLEKKVKNTPRDRRLNELKVGDVAIVTVDILDDGYSKFRKYNKQSFEIIEFFDCGKTAKASNGDTTIRIPCKLLEKVNNSCD